MKSVLIACALLLSASAVLAQQPRTQSQATTQTGALDAAAIRRRAGQIAELKSLLADPDANVRLVAVQDATASTDATLRAIAIEAGLASNEVGMTTTALRGTLTGRDSMLVRYADKPGVDSELNATLTLFIASFDISSGRADGKSSCAIIGTGESGEWTGILSGTSFTFTSRNMRCSGRFEWSSESGEFKGTFNLKSGDASGERKATWKPF